ncbi:classical arabinogalactan protein 9-like [Vitis riparia]|uniref:classical arabinogalactan protein 9-like n=1 Tax=Vitis riparia TaxID=96939 RepID=UPI00155A7844|nr:classical arabinogalactan protein 9-like [Vitis riparia]
MASLVHFEEKVHRKKLQRANTIPLLFPRLLCQILEHMGFPTEPQHERRRICRERFTLDKWNQLAGYFAFPGAHPMVAPPEPPQTEQTKSTLVSIKQGELPTKTIPPAPASPTSAPPVPMPEAVSAAPPMTPTVPPVAPTTSEPSITISASEFRGLPNLSALSEPLAPVEDTIPTEDTTTAEVQMLPPQEATTDAIASVDPQDEPQTVDTITTTPEDASSPPEAPTI